MTPPSPSASHCRSSSPIDTVLAAKFPILLCDANTDKVAVICGQGVTPAAATSEKFDELGLGLIPGTGLLSACVPGQFDAWMLLLLRWGTMSLRDVMSYMIDLARNGDPNHSACL